MDVIIRKWSHLGEGYVSTNEGLSVSSIQIEPGTQDLNRKINCNGSKRYYTLVGDDMLADIYQLDTLKVNEVRIEMADTEKEEISGSFEINFRIADPSRPRQLPYWPDTVKLSNGSFVINIPEGIR